MRKGIKGIISLVFVFIIAFTLSSCGISKWEFTKAEAGNFVSLDAGMTKSEDEKYKINIRWFESLDSDHLF